MSGFLIVAVLLSLLLVATAATKSIYTMETELRNKLLANYDPQVPPLTNAAGNSKVAPVKVNTGMEVYKVKSVDMHTGVLDMEVWVRAQWTDPRLKWNEVPGYEEYQTISTVEFRSTPHEKSAQIWAPDFQLYNGEEDYSIANSIVNPSGSVWLAKPTDIRVVCSFKDSDLYPFHSISCNMRFGGWSSSGYKIDYNSALGLKAEYGIYDNFIVDVARSKATTTQFFYPCCPDEPWPTVTYEIHVYNTGFQFAKTIVMMNVLIVIISFCTLWFDIKQKEAIETSAWLFLSLMLTDVAAHMSININSDRMNWIYTFLAYSITAVFMVFVANFLGRYWDNASQRLQERLTMWDKSRFSYAFTPGAVFRGGFLERMGWDNFGYITKFFLGFLMPMIYGGELCNLSGQLLGQSITEAVTQHIEDAKNNTPITTGVEGLAAGMMATGVLLIIFAIISFFGEITSRYLGVNFKVDRYETDEKDAVRRGRNFKPAQKTLRAISTSKHLSL